MDVRPRKLTNGCDLRASLDNIALPGERRDVRQVVENAAIAADYDDAGTVTAPSRHGVCVRD